MSEVQLPKEAALVVEVFLPLLTRSRGKRLIKDLQMSANRLVKEAEFEKAQLALLLADYLEPRVEAIAVTNRGPKGSSDPGSTEPTTTTTKSAKKSK